MSAKTRRREGTEARRKGSAGGAVMVAAGVFAWTQLAAAESDGANWPSFRGPSASGVAEGHPTAVEWDVESGRNVTWTTKVPGLAHSCPVIWGDRIFLTTAVREGAEADLRVGLYGNVDPVEDDAVHELRVLCLDKRSGAVRWSKVAWSGVPKIKRHTKGSHAASTPATDGKRVVAFFGSEGLYCYDVEGEPVWKRDLGVLDSGYYMAPDAQWGFASSPVIHEDLVIVQCDVQKASFIAALSLADGAEVWRTPREEVPTWSTPTVHVAGGRSQVIANGWKHIGGYDLRSGKELWKLVGGGDIPVPTPVVAGGLIFITNGHGRWPIYAIRAGAEGTVTEDTVSERGHMAWMMPRRGNYMQTPLVYGEHLYMCSDAGILACYVAATGEMLYRKRLGGGGTGFTASAVAADGKLYLTSETGDVHVVRAGPEFELLAVNGLGETCMATPAVSEGTLYFRARHHLIAVSPGS